MARPKKKDTGAGRDAAPTPANPNAPVILLSSICLSAGGLVLKARVPKAFTESELHGLLSGNRALTRQVEKLARAGLLRFERSMPEPEPEPELPPPPQPVDLETLSTEALEGMLASADAKIAMAIVEILGKRDKLDVAPPVSPASSDPNTPAT